MLSIMFTKFYLRKIHIHKHVKQNELYHTTAGILFDKCNSKCGYNTTNSDRKLK